MNQVSEITGMLKDLRKELRTYPGSHYRTIAARSGKSLGAVSQALNGEVFNHEILKVATDYRDELRAKYLLEYEILKKKLSS